MPSFWTALGLKQHKAFVTPTSCKYCRAIKRANWKANRRTTTKVDADGNPIEEVAALAMAADDAGDPDLFSQEPLTEPLLIDLDAGDDDAISGRLRIEVLLRAHAGCEGRLRYS